MRRGYVKLWRCAEDSRLWSRGIEYRGLLVTLLARANYRESSFGGEKILPGQLAISMQRLAEDLGISRDKLIRMLRNLQKDGVISHKQAHNRFTVITILNFSQYQDGNHAGHTTDRTTNHTTAAQQPHTSKEGKNIYSSSLRSEELPTEASADGSTSPVQVIKNCPPNCPQQRVIDLYREILPELPAPRVWDESRQKQLRTRWREAWERLKKAGKPHDTEGVLAWWKTFFIQVKASPWLMGQVSPSNGRASFLADLVWLTKKSNFAKVIDGVYLHRGAA